LYYNLLDVQVLKKPQNNFVLIEQNRYHVKQLSIQLILIGSFANNLAENRLEFKFLFNIWPTQAKTMPLLHIVIYVC